MEKIYYQIREVAFNTALYLLNDSNDAEDIAQIVCLKFLQNQEQIKNPSAWCKTVARHEVFTLLKKQNLEITGLEAKLELLEAERPATCEEIIPEFETIISKEAKSLLSKEEYKFYNLMLKYEQDSKKIAKHLKRSISYVYGFSYRVKRNLVSAKLLKEGYRGTKEIIDYNTNKKIIFFIKTLIDKMQKNDLKSLKRYFQNCESEIPLINITQHFDYEVYLIAPDIFHLSVPYQNEKNKLDIFTVIFALDKKRNIKIQKFIPQANRIYRINMPSEEADKMLLPLKKGVPQESLEELKEKFKNILDIYK